MEKELRIGWLLYRPVVELFPIIECVRSDIYRIPNGITISRESFYGQKIVGFINT